ncbi:MAG: alpha/beta fold hydrolase [Proteobacteria bacterium]|nr:alpha/beta fold hydrolase [Pseudomonadota bacterium]
MEPYRYRNDGAALAHFTRRLTGAHRVAAAPDPEGRLGIPPADLERLVALLADYDWPAFEARLNEHPAFVATARTGRLHFVHARSAQADALPLLALHGWPGSFLEFRQLIGPWNRGSPAFHLVCPSLPGYAFSARSLEVSCDTAAMADVFAELMTALGYPRFLVQGGDWGSMIAVQIARRHPGRCLGVHLNFTPFPPPPPDDPARGEVTAEEARALAEGGRAWADGMGYYLQQGTRPQTLAAALGDSARGLTAWLAEKHLAWSDRTESGASRVSDTAIADHVALYWLTGSIGSAIRLYYDERHATHAITRVEVPTGVAVFPRELLQSPRAWVARHCNLTHWSLQPYGGHFAALEAPELLEADVRTFAAPLAAGAR